MANDFENKRIDKMVEVLNDLSDDDLMSLFRDANSYDGKYEFVDGRNMGEFLTMMMEGKKGSELVDFIMEVASAIDNYNGSDGIEDAAWGYPGIYGLEIRDWSDIAEQGRDDYLDDLAQDVIEDGRTSKFGVLPSEVEELLDEFDSEDGLGWEGAGTYLLDNDEDDPANYRTFDGDSVDPVDYWDNYIEECGAEYLRDLLGEYDCGLSELAEMMADDMGIKGTIDCSLYPETYAVDGIDWYFESMGCGQHDTRGEMAEYVNEDAYNVLHELWDKCHLKKVNSGIADTMEHIAHVLSLTNTEDWITDYIHRHIDELC